MMEICFNVNNENLIRIDKYLVLMNHQELYSRSMIDKYIEEGFVKVNDKSCRKKSHLVKIGDVIKVNIIKNLIDNPLPKKENIPLEIIYEDDYLAVINKPGGLVVHPAPGNYEGTLVNALLYYFDDSLDLSDSDRPGIVHRLDKDTSGLIVVAKDNKMQYDLSKLFMERKVGKTYLCIALGVPKELNGTIEAPIGRHKTDRKKMAIIDKGRSAVSEYETLIDFEYFSLIKVKILTGRTHQIRVHLESIHNPVIGDETYNSIKRVLGSVPLEEQKKVKSFLNKYISRQLLHSYKLSFVHPVKKQEMTFISNLPEDFKNIIKFLKNSFNYYIINEDEVKKIEGLL